MAQRSDTFSATAGGNTFTIRMEGDKLLIEDAPVSASLVQVNDHLYSLLLNHVSYDLVVMQEEESTWVTIHGHSVPVTLKDAKTRLLEKFEINSREKATTQSLRAPMPGLVLRVNVQVGETVTAGQGLLVLEAMKMENELQAAADGTISRIHAAEGDAVAKNALLIDFDS